MQSHDDAPGFTKYTSNISKILTIQEEIALAYLIPSFTTQTGRNIRSQETTTQLHELLNMEADELAEINRKMTDQEKEIELEEQMKAKYDRDNKLLIISIQLQNSIISIKNNEIKLLSIEVKNSIDSKLNMIAFRVAEIDAYVESLDNYKSMLVNEYEKIMHEIHAIHYDEPFIIVLDEEKNIHAKIDLNEVVVKLGDRISRDDSITGVEHHIEQILQEIIDEQTKDQTSENTIFKDFVKENKPTIFQDLNDKHRFNEVATIANRAKLLINEIKKVDNAKKAALDEKNNLVKTSESIKRAEQEISAQMDNINLTQDDFFKLDEKLNSCKKELAESDGIINNPLERMTTYNDLEDFINAKTSRVHDTTVHSDATIIEKEQELSNENTQSADSSPSASEDSEQDDFEKQFFAGDEVEQHTSEEQPTEHSNSTAAIFNTIPPDEVKATNHHTEEHKDSSKQKPQLEHETASPAKHQDKVAAKVPVDNNDGSTFRRKM